LEYSKNFQSFGWPEAYKASPDVVATAAGYKTVEQESKPLVKCSANMDQWESRQRISCISNERTLPLALHTDRMMETRFSLPANVFLQPNIAVGEETNNSKAISAVGKYATLGHVKKNNCHAASDLLPDSDSSTESSIQHSKQAARLSRRLRKYKNHKRKCRSQSSLESPNGSSFSLLASTADSRELTEPECDREYWLHGNERSGSNERDLVENISREQLQQELDMIIANYKAKKNKKNEEKAAEDKFTISV